MGSNSTAQGRALLALWSRAFRREHFSNSGCDFPTQQYDPVQVRIAPDEKALLQFDMPQRRELWINDSCSRSSLGAALDAMSCGCARQHDANGFEFRLALAKSGSILQSRPYIPALFAARDVQTHLESKQIQSAILRFSSVGHLSNGSGICLLCIRSLLFFVRCPGE